jgi:translation initiation factor IF-3
MNKGFKKNKGNVNNVRIYYNRGIRAAEVRCIDADNNNIGVISINDALAKASECGLDLVQISHGSEGIPICRIVDYGKYKYELSKNQKESAKKQRESIVKLKEIKLRPTTDINDLRVKALKAEEILKEGNRVKISIIFRGREITHKEVGWETLKKFTEMISELNLTGEPSMQGRVLTVIGERKEKK